MEQLSYEPLTPISFLRRSALVFGDRTAVVDGELRLTYAELLERAERLAGALLALGARAGGRVAVLAPNTHVMLEAHYGVPLAGAVLVALNFRLTPAELAYIVDHAGARVLVYDHSLAAQAKEVARLAPPGLRLVEAGGEPDEYEGLLAGAEPRSVRVDDERALISLNYTSGTTGKPKGVMYHHRGAYLQALAMAYHAQLEPRSVYLWTLPMFHCNGWCFTWAVIAAGALHLCLPRVDPVEIWRLMGSEGVTHLCAAPTVLGSLVHHPDARPVPHPVRVATGAPRPPRPSSSGWLSSGSRSRTSTGSPKPSAQPSCASGARSGTRSLPPSKLVSRLAKA